MRQQIIKHRSKKNRSSTMNSLLRERDRFLIKKAFNVISEDSPLMRKIRLKAKCPFLQHSRGKQMDVIFNAESRLLMFKRGPF